MSGLHNKEVPLKDQVLSPLWPLMVKDCLSRNLLMEFLETQAVLHKEKPMQLSILQLSMDLQLSMSTPLQLEGMDYLEVMDQFTEDLHKEHLLIQVKWTKRA